MKRFLKKKTLTTVLGIGIIALAGCKQGDGTANAADTYKDNTEAGATLTKITKNQFDIKNTFPVKGHDLTGYVMQPKVGGEPTIFYANNRTGDVIYGVVFDKDGNNLTEQYINKFIQPLMAKKLFESVEDANSFLVGSKDAPHEVYMVGEPNCSVCHKLYTAMKPYVDNGQLAIHWIMTAFLRPDSTGKAAAILQSDDPAKMLEKDESDAFDMKKEEGAGKTLSSEKISAKTKELLKANMQFMVKSGIRGTPVVFYRDVNGVEKRIDGYPQKDIGAFIKMVGRLSTKPESKSISSSANEMSSIPDKKDS